MENLIKKLEAEGRIPQGKYIPVFESSEINISVAKTKDEKYGIFSTDTNLFIPAIFDFIKKDENGNYICSVIKDGKAFYNIYDSELNLIGGK